jgi:hypothetical protein
MDFYNISVFVFVGVFIIHTIKDYPDRFLIYPPMEHNNIK